MLARKDVCRLWQTSVHNPRSNQDLLIQFWTVLISGWWRLSRLFRHCEFELCHYEISFFPLITKFYFVQRNFCTHIDLCDGFALSSVRWHHPWRGGLLGLVWVWRDHHVLHWDWLQHWWGHPSVEGRNFSLRAGVDRRPSQTAGACELLRRVRGGPSDDSSCSFILNSGH